jgi:soluble lytic murein transglycosylase-like protein
MSGTTQTRRAFSFFPLIVATALLAAASAGQAQTCGGKLPTPEAGTAAPGGEKFKLINQQCPALAEPAAVRRAGQLDLYERGSVTIHMSEPVEETPASRPAPVPAPPPQPASAAPTRDVARVMELAPAITEAAQIYNIDPLLLHAIAHVESRHRTDAVSPAGARGAMQMMPATARRFGVADERTLLDGSTNVRASAAYIRTLRIRYGDDVRLVLAAYNAGEGAVDKNGGVPPYPETQAYVRDVLAVYRRLTATFAVTPAGTLVSRNEQRGDK